MTPTDDSARPDPGGNPSIVDLEPVAWLVKPDLTVGGVVFEVADQTGNGFRTMFDQRDALDVDAFTINLRRAVEHLGDQGVLIDRLREKLEALAKAAA